MSRQGGSGLEEYAAARWPAAVRTLVLLGAPPPVAHRLADEAVARLLAAPDAGFDHATALFGEVVATWEDDRSSWWEEPSLPTVLDRGLESRLDALDPATRARLVLAAVAELTPEQVDEVLVAGPDGTEGPAGLAPEAAQAAQALRVDRSDVAAVASRVRARSRRRRTAGWAVAVAAALLVAGGAVVLVDPQDPEPAAAEPPAAGFRPPGLPTTERSVVVRNDGDEPVPWYDGRVVHLGDRVVEVESLRSMARVRGGVAGVLADGVVVVVTARDGVQVLGRTRPDGVVATSPDSAGVAWLDPDGDLVLAQVAPAQLRVSLPVAARLVLRDGTDTYVAVRSTHLVIDDRTRRRDVLAPAPLDVAGTTRLVAGPTGPEVVTPSGTLVLAGRAVAAARLSDDGRYLLTSGATSSSSVPDEVVEVATGEPVDLPVPDDGRVVDVAFGPGTTVTMALSRPDGARFPSTIPRGSGAQPGYDLVTCRLREGTCQVVARLDNVPRAPLVAR